MIGTHGRKCLGLRILVVKTWNFGVRPGFNLLVLSLMNCVSLGKSSDFLRHRISHGFFFGKLEIREESCQSNKVRYVKYLEHRSESPNIINCFSSPKEDKILKQFPIGVAATWWLPWIGREGAVWEAENSVSTPCRFQGKFRMVLLPSGGQSSLGAGYTSSVFTAFSCLMLLDNFIRSWSLNSHPEISYLWTRELIPNTMFPSLWLQTHL